MRANCRLFCWIALAVLTCAGQEKDPNAVWKKADEGLRQAFERVVYRLKDAGPGRYQGVNPGQRLALEFRGDDARLKHPQGDVALRLSGYGYGARLRTPLKATPTASGNRLEYKRGELTEWYVNDSRGLEQGFTLARRPGRSRDGGPLVIALGVSGELRPELAAQGDAVLLRSSKGTVLRYAGLRAWDARGRALASRLQVSERDVRLVVEDHDAEYPLVVDPVWTQEAELTASDGAKGDAFGISVAASGDTAVVGAWHKTVGSNQLQGAAYVFVRSGATWSQQQELTASDGAYPDNFGSSVSVSGDTAVVGATFKTIGPNQYQGAAYVFVRSGTTWSRQQELTASDGKAGDEFGWSVAVSGDTAVVGAVNKTIGLNPGQGAAYVFVRSGATWSQQQELTASDGAPSDNFGFVAVSGDTAVAGAPGAYGSNLHGSAYVFVRSGTTWSQQQKLTASDGAAGDTFGVSVSVSGDTAVVGAYLKTIGSNHNQGAAYMFVRSGTAWSQQQELTAAGVFFGVSVSVSGNTAVVGAYGTGAAYVFVGSGTTSWTQRQELTASDGVGHAFGFSVSVSGDTAVVAACDCYSNPSYQGAAYVFTPSMYVLNDFAGNGHSGALLYVPSSGAEYTALSNGNGTYTYAPNIFTPGFDTLRSGDFNGDGKADLVVYNSQTALAYIGLGNGDGTFNFQSLFWSPGYNFVEPGDLNGDGKTDVALYNSTTGTMYTGISNGTGGFTYKYTLISMGYTYLKLADFNGDGKADLFAYNSVSGNAAVGLGDGQGGFAFHSFQISPGYSLIDVGDLNADGKADVVLYNAASGNAATGISDGLGGFTFTSMPFSAGFTAIKLADFTGHAGKADVVLYNANTSLAYFGTGTGTGAFTFVSLFWSPGYDWVVPEDVNGDGKIDVVLYNSATGTEYTGISNGDGTFNYTYQYWGIGRVLAR